MATEEPKLSLIARVLAYPLLAAMILTPIALVVATGIIIVHFVVKYW